MTVERNYAIVNAIAHAMLSDWLKNIASVFQPMRSKTKINRPLYARFFPLFEQATGKSSNVDWFIALFTAVVIGRANYSGISFSTVIWKPLSLYSPEHLHKNFKVSARQMIVV